MGTFTSNHYNGALRQTTLKSAIGCCGTGLHSGAKVAMTLLPADPDSGVVFRRTDLGGLEIPGHVKNVVDSRLGTTLGNDGGATVATVEHLMAAFSGCGLDNVVVALDGPEVPVMDGSSAPFVFLVECAGLIELDAARQALEILKEVRVGDDKRTATLTPAECFSMDFEIDFESGAVGQQALGVRLINGTFKSELSRARTFGFAHEFDKLREMGLTRGGSLDNAVVVSGDIVLNEDGLRYDDEFVRHKMLDGVGDLYLAGTPIIGHFSGRRSGHSLNHALLRAVFADPTAYQYTPLTHVAPAEPLLASA